MSGILNTSALVPGQRVRHTRTEAAGSVGSATPGGKPLQKSVRACQRVVQSASQLRSRSTWTHTRLKLLTRESVLDLCIMQALFDDMLSEVSSNDKLIATPKCSTHDT